MKTLVRFKVEKEEFIPEFIEGPVLDIENYKGFIKQTMGYDLLHSTLPRFRDYRLSALVEHNIKPHKGDFLEYEKHLAGDLTAIVIVKSLKIKDNKKIVLDVVEKHVITLFEMDNIDFSDTAFFEKINKEIRTLSCLVTQ